MHAARTHATNPIPVDAFQHERTAIVDQAAKLSARSQGRLRQCGYHCVSTHIDAILPLRWMHHPVGKKNSAVSLGSLDITFDELYPDYDDI